MYQRVYQLRTDSETRPTESEIAAALGIYPGSPYENDSNATCDEVEIGPGPEPTRPPHLCYHLAVKWATNAVLPANTDPGTQSDPTTRRTLWAVRPTIQNRYVVVDKNGDLIVNSAGQPFDGGIPVDARLGTVIFRRNVLAVGYDKEMVLRDSGKVNSTTFLGAEPGTLQCDIEAEEHFEGAFHYVSETYTLAYDPTGHQPKPVDAGFYQRTTPDGPVLERIEIDGAPINEPEPLLEDGTVVPIADRPGSCRVVPVEYFDEKEFADFGLV